MASLYRQTCPGQFVNIFEQEDKVTTAQLVPLVGHITHNIYRDNNPKHAGYNVVPNKTGKFFGYERFFVPTFSETNLLNRLKIAENTENPIVAVIGDKNAKA